MKPEWKLLGQSCVTRVLVIVMFLPVARARAGANEQSLAWLPVLLNTWAGCIQLTEQQHHQTNNRKKKKTNQQQNQTGPNL